MGLLALPQAASGHVERRSYWRDSKADCTVKPCVSGKVPKARTLRSALDGSRPGQTRVVCKPGSLHRLRASVRHARKDGFYIRPTDHRSLTAKHARALLRINKRLLERCRYQSIQRAVTASGNNNRAWVMPGLYKERHSRRQPTHDPACKQYLIKSDSGDPNGPTLGMPWRSVRGGEGSGAVSHVQRSDARSADPSAANGTKPAKQTRSSH